MKNIFKKLMVVSGALVVVLSFAPNSIAQCGAAGKAKAIPGNWLSQSGQIRLLPAAFQNADEQDDRFDKSPSIVGFWQVVFTAKTLNGSAIPETVIDNALVVWHSDGTEIMNSGRPPQDGNFCMGVWKQTGPSSYKLNHFALGNQYAPGTANGVVGDPAGPTRITESVKVSFDGNHFSGSFTLTATDTLGNPVTVFTGIVTATRITLDTTVADIL